MNGYPLTLSPAQITQARQQAMQQQASVLSVLRTQLACDETTLLQAAGQLLGYLYVEFSQLEQVLPKFERLPLARALKLTALLCERPATDETGSVRLFAVVADPFDTDLLRQLESYAEQPIAVVLAKAENIHACLARFEDRASPLGLKEAQTTVRTEDIDEANEQITLSAISEETSVVVKTVNATLYDALRVGASDIHLETLSTGLAVKFRIDGVLQETGMLAGIAFAEQVISRIKVLAGLDIGERRIPQDGRFSINSRGRKVDLRVSVMPSLRGEDAVLRILDKHTILQEGSVLTLDVLGFEAEVLTRIRRLAREPYGMLLVTGPTGSGKTTTLYAAISEINTGLEKIITIEDPVEYELPGVLQIPVNDKKGLTFARGLRSILRHDPDKIMVGEIRDAETAEIAVQSALTGHLVLTTVHANNTIDVFNRFTHMGIDPYALTSALNGVWAQRLMRTVCRECSVEFTPTALELEAAGLQNTSLAAFQFRHGRGCEACRHTGYRGRKAIAEFLALDDGLRGLIAGRMPVVQIKEEARARGTCFLRDAALNLVQRGESTLEELVRVTLSN